MDVNSQTGPVQCLLSRMVEICSTADHSPTARDFAEEIAKARAVARDLSHLTGVHCLTCRAELQEFLETTERMTCPGRRPEDRELIGLTEWASHLHDLCEEQDLTGSCAKSKASAVDPYASH